MFFDLNIGELHVGHVWAMLRYTIYGIVGLRDGLLIRRSSPSLRSRLGSAVSELTIEKFYKLVESVSRQAMLSKKIRGVLLTEHFLDVEAAAADGLLDPQRVSIYMPQFAKALPRAYTDGGRGIGPEPQRHVKAEIL